MLNVDVALSGSNVDQGFQANKKAGTVAPVATPTGTGPAFDKSFFRFKAETTGASLSEAEQNNLELVRFAGGTRREVSNFLKGYVANHHRVWNEPGGRSVIKQQDPNTEQLLSMLGGTDTKLDRNKVNGNIEKFLNTPEGWVAAKTLLEQQTATQLYLALGQYLTSQPEGRRELTADNLDGFFDRIYVNGEGVVHKIDRHALEFFKDHWKTMVKGGITIAGAGLPWVVASAATKGATIETKDFWDGIRMAQQDPSTQKYIKELWDVDVTDWVDDGKGGMKQKDGTRGTRANIKEFALGIVDNTRTRMHIYDDLGVPPEARDYMPEQSSVFGGKNGPEQTGLVVDKEIHDRVEALRKEDREGRRKKGPENPLAPAEQQAALLLDKRGRDPHDPLRGRDYAEGVILPPFQESNLLPEPLDTWKQNNNSPWHRRADGKTIRLLGANRVSLERDNRPSRVRGRGEPAFSLKEGANPGEYQYAYESRKTEKNIPLDRIFYIDATGVQVPLIDTATPANNILTFDTDGKPVYQHNGNQVDRKDMFYIPADGSPPIPHTILDIRPNLTLDRATGQFVPNGDPSFSCKKRATTTVTVREQALTGVNPATGNRESMVNISPPPTGDTTTNLETFRRDNQGIAPAGEPLSFLYGRNFSPRQLQQAEALAANGVFDKGITPDELLQYLQEGNLSSEKRTVITRLAKARNLPAFLTREDLNKELAARREPEVKPLTPDNFQARDAAGRAPTDIRFGISNPNILAALNIFDTQHPQPNPAFFQTNGPNAGLDIWEQAPNDPFFCRADRTAFTYQTNTGPQSYDLRDFIKLDIIATDAWGQQATYEDGTPNLFFKKGKESDTTGQPKTELQLIMEARKIVLGTLIERAGREILANPTKNLSTIEAKIRERQRDGETDGVLLAARKAEALADRGPLTYRQGSLTERKDAIETYQTTQQELAKSQQELTAYLEKNFGLGTTDDQNAIENIRDFIQGSGDLRVRFKGRIQTLTSAGDREREATDEHAREYTRIASRSKEPVDLPNGTQRLQNEDEYRMQTKALQNEADTLLDTKLHKIEEEKDYLRQIQAEIEKQQLTIKGHTETLSPTGDAGRERNAAIYPSAEDLDHISTLAEELKNKFTDKLFTTSPTAILKKINELNESNTDIGWPTNENKSAFAQEFLIQTLLLARAKDTTPDAVNNFIDTGGSVRRLLTEGLTIHEIESLSATELTARHPTINSGDIDVAKTDLKNFANAMTQATNRMYFDTERHITRVEHDAQMINFDDEINQLAATRDAMANVGYVSGMTTEVMADVEKYFATKAGATKTITDLTTEEKTGITKAELNFGADVPVGFLELLDVFFKHKGRSDQEDYVKQIKQAITPENFYKILQKKGGTRITGTTSAEISLSLNNAISKKLIDESTLRRMFVAVIDDMEARALAIPDSVTRRRQGELALAA